MKQKAIIHDHASASFEQVEQAALDRGIKADIGLRDTELECAKYRRVMALEAELDAWQLKCGKERDKSEHLQNELRHAETLTQAYSKDLQIMSASWKAVSVERDNLERGLSQREQHLKSCENALTEVHEKCKTQQALIELRDAQIALNKSAALIAERESKRLIDKAKSQRNACQAVAFLAVALFLPAVSGGGV